MPKSFFNAEMDNEAFHNCVFKGQQSQFYVYFRPFVESVIKKIFLKKSIPFTDEDVEELRNDAFVKFFENNCENLRRYNPEVGLRPSHWIALLTSRSVLNHLRQKSLDGLSERQNRESMEVLEKAFGSEDNRLQAREVLMQIDAALPLLPNLERLVFKLHFFKGMSLKAIAISTQKSMTSVYAAKSRAIGRLKKITRM